MRLGFVSIPETPANPGLPQHAPAMKEDRAAENPAAERHRSLARWRNRWTALVFAIGLATAVFLFAAILLFVKESWIPAALSTLASLLGGGAVGWLVTRRQEAVLEEERAFQLRAEAARKDEERDRGRQSRDAILGRKNST